MFVPFKKVLGEDSQKSYDVLTIEIRKWCTIGATTNRIMPFAILTLSKTVKCDTQYDDTQHKQCHYSKCYIFVFLLNVVILNVIMMTVVA